MKRRPLGIWIIVATQMLLAGTLLAGAAANTDILSGASDQPLEPEARVVYIGWAIITLVFAFWLWRLKRRGWVLTMLITGLALAANLVTWWSGDPNFLRMGLQAVTAFYLNSAPVRDLFLVDSHRPDPPLLREMEA